MKTLAIDESSHNILLEAKKEVEKTGLEKPSHSDTIRWMWNKILECDHN